MDTPVRARRNSKSTAKTAVASRTAGTRMVGTPRTAAGASKAASAATARAAMGVKDPVEAPNLDLRKLLRALQSVREGDFSVRLASDQTGLAGKVADTFNEIVSSNQRLALELERAGQIVGKDGKTRHRVSSDRRPLYNR